MELLVRFIEAIVWPALILWFILYFREPLRTFVEKLKYVRLGDFEASIESEIDEANEKVLEVKKRLGENTKTNEIEVPPYGETEQLSWLASVAPRAAIVEAWVSVEKAIAEAAVNLPLTEPERRITRKLILDIRRRGYIDKSALDAYLHLQNVRNSVVHSPGDNVSAETAQRFIDIAGGLINVLREASGVST